MESLWNEDEARACGGDPLALRVYTSRLIGREPELVLHGGGNTSVKADVTDLFGGRERVLYVKGSGWNLETIEPAGFAPVRLALLERMAELEALSDADMVRAQRAAMTEPGAPSPSVEAILHAIIPFDYVDHTHADAIVTVTNTEEGEARIRDVYGDSVLIVPYVMPGFALARDVYLRTRELDWSTVRAIVLMNHGVFTFADDAKESYERMIEVVSAAEEYLSARAAVGAAQLSPAPADWRMLARIRRKVSALRGAPVLAVLDSSAPAAGFATRPDVEEVAARGPLTPDHVIRTKRVPAVVGERLHEPLEAFAREYDQYFHRNAGPGLTQLDPAPRWIIWRDRGSIGLGRTLSEAGIIGDIARHTMRAIERAELLGGWQALDEADIFDVEYWELEQAKLSRASAPAEFAGKVALVTGAASGIGRACAIELAARGAAVVAADVDEAVLKAFAEHAAVVGVVCDVTQAEPVRNAVETALARFGGLDIVVSNAGTFPASETIAEMSDETWARSLDVNLSGHRRVIQASIPYLELGLDPAIVVIGSKNVLAPGPGASAYSTAKAGLAQLARVAALELAPLGIRVNVIHPNDVFDTGVWTPEVLESRAQSYGMTVDAYKRRNLLGAEVSSAEVAAMACAMAGALFAKTTGAQVPIDGGNDRVI